MFLQSSFCIQVSCRKCVPLYPYIFDDILLFCPLILTKFLKTIHNNVVTLYMFVWVYVCAFFISYFLFIYVPFSSSSFSVIWLDIVVRSLSIWLPTHVSAVCQYVHLCEWFPNSFNDVVSPFFSSDSCFA